MPERHAVYATCEIAGEKITFRIGQPTDWRRAQARWERLYPISATSRNVLGRVTLAILRGRVRHARRWYRVSFMEVRAVDRHGRGLGSERHERAIPVPYRQFQRARKV